MNLLFRIERFYHKFENLFAATLLFVMAILPVAEIFLRKIFNTGIAGSNIYVQYLTLWVGFVGAIVAARDKRHLTLSPNVDFLPLILRGYVINFKNFVTTAVCAGLLWASVQMVIIDMSSGNIVAG